MPVIPPIPEGLSAAELAVDRLNTQAFIASNPMVLTLIPREPLRTGSGVRFTDGQPRLLQVGRLIDVTGGGGGAGPQTSGDGFQRKDLFQLLLPFDGDVELNDYWEDDAGIRYEVTGILPYNGYEMRAEVTRYGQKGQPPV
jgi:hypothetical protein